MKRHGFTLLELSMVIIIVSLMLSGILTIVTQNARIEKRAQLAEKLERIKTAMLDFRKMNNRLPCPGEADVPQTDDTFGVEGSPPAQCADDMAGTIFETAAPGAYGGGIPVRTLQIPDEYAFDPWGNRFLYIVDYRITAAAATNPFNTYPASHSSIGNITVRDIEGDSITTRALYLIVSHGPNGHGGYTRTGIRKSAKSTNASEQANCHCDADAGPKAFTALFYQAPEISTSVGPTEGFDDTVIYIKRQDLLSAAEEDTETR